MLACGERGYGHGSTSLCVTRQYHLASMAAWLSSTGISLHNLLPHIPSIRLFTVNNNPRPRIMPHSPNSSSQQLHHIDAQLSLRQSCHRQKIFCIYAHRVASVEFNSLRPCRLWPAMLLCQGKGFCRQEYWSLLATTSFHTLLEHYISYYPSCQPPSTWGCQNPCDPSSCTTSTPGPHRGKPKSSKAASGENPSGQPTYRGVNKTTTKNQGQCS